MADSRLATFPDIPVSPLVLPRYIDSIDIKLYRDNDIDIQNTLIEHS